jgi:phenylalanyl-tRNA synthetase alpha chain
MSNSFTEHFATCQTVNECLKKFDELNHSGTIQALKERLLVVTDLTEKKQLGQQMNELKTQLKQACDQRIQEIQQAQLTDHWLEFDPTFASATYQNRLGNLHPIRLVVEDLVRIFQQLGFDVFDGPLVETQWYNFTAPNSPEYHPSRDMQDTFFLDQVDTRQENYVMRTQVTANIVRYAETHKPPFRVVFPGLVFRNENIDATHDINFTQFDMWLVDKYTTIGQLVNLIKHLFREFFGDKNINIRLRPSYFPFTLPSFEVDFSCPFCGGKGCRVCKHTGWIECAGAGPIHPKVIENMGLNPEEWDGLAFGFGVDRLAQLKYGVTGVSQFYNGHLDFLKGE